MNDESAARYASASNVNFCIRSEDINEWSRN